MNSSDSEYKKIVEERIKSINEEIEKLKNRRIAIFRDIDAEIKGLEVEREDLRKKLNEPREKLPNENIELFLSSTDTRYKNNIKTQKTYQEQINYLNKLKSDLESKRQRAKIDRKIGRINQKIEKLKSKNIKLGKQQRIMMYPKYKRELIKNGLLRRQEGRIEYNKSMIKDNETLANSMNTEKISGLIGKIVYDRRAERYRKRAERSKALLEEMKTHNTIIGIRGSRLIYIPKNLYYGTDFEFKDTELQQEDSQSRTM